jgi:HAD superfamily hydrolase (TIGR01490 family)
LIVFDVDGTILPGTSCERLFVRYLIKNRIIGLRSFFNFCLNAINLGPMGRYFIIKANKGYLRGYPVENMAKLGRDFFAGVVPRISQTAAARIKKHLSNGERVVLFSGMPDFLLTNFANHLGVSEYYGSVMGKKDGRFTGHTNGPFPLAEGKIEALKMIIEDSDDESGTDWPSITFYADHWTDRFLLGEVGHPVVVNGQPRLRSLAIREGWPIEEWI